MSVRLVVAILVLAALVGGLWWAASLAPSGVGGAQAVSVFVVGPSADGANVLANGTVTASTPLEAVQALGARGSFDVVVEQQPWIGRGCTAAYVVSIAGIGETTTGGWNYYVRAPQGDWTWKPAGAACYSMSPGEQVEWCWVESDVCHHHAP